MVAVNDVGGSGPSGEVEAWTSGTVPQPPVPPTLDQVGTHAGLAQMLRGQ